MKADTPFKLEQCIIKPREYSIECSAGNNKIMQPKFIEVLAYLASQYPRLVDRQELIENIWDGNHYVGEKALTNAIWNLRNEFKQTDNDYIETIRKKGYRLLVEPEYLADETAQSLVETSSGNKKRSRNKWLAFSLFCFLSFFILYQFIPFESESIDSVNLKNIIADPGREVYPVVSPDQQLLVYSWRRIGKQPNLYLKNFTNLSIPPKQLTFSEDYEGRVVWHPNGEHIYFQRKHWNYARCDIMQLNINTNEQKNVGSCIGEIDFSLAISPDGKSLAYIDIDEKTSEQIVHLLNLNNGETSRAYQCDKACSYKDSDVEFSPDGKYLAITRTLDEGLNEEIFLLNRLTKNLKTLTAIAGSVKGLNWHPKSDRLVFSTQISDQRDGYLISIDDKKITQLKIPGFSYPNFIPQSNDIIFHHWQVLSSLSSISLQDSVAASPFPYIQSGYSYQSPHYSSVNKKMVFISNESGFDELWTSDIDGTNRKKLTSLERHLTFPRWSHNGEYIAFLGPKKQGNALYVLTIKSNIVKKLDNSFEQYFRPSWLQDNSGLIVPVRNEQQTALYAFPITRKAPYLLLNRAVTYAEQTTDGKIWFSPDRNKGLWRFNPQQQDNQVEQVLNKDLFRVSYNWELTEKGIYFQHDYAQHHQINFFDLVTERITPVVKLPKGTLQRVSSITLIPSNNKLVFTQLEFPKVDTKRLSHPLLQ